MMVRADASPTILVVDDSPGIRSLIERELRPLAQKVTGAGTTTEARAILAKEYFDLVITDVLMPDGDGLEVIAETKRRYPSARILAITEAGSTWATTTACI